MMVETQILEDHEASIQESESRRQSIKVETEDVKSVENLENLNNNNNPDLHSQQREMLCRRKSKSISNFGDQTLTPR